MRNLTSVGLAAKLASPVAEIPQHTTRQASIEHAVNKNISLLSVAVVESSEVLT